jgi:enoyl-CoA hydratase
MEAAIDAYEADATLRCAVITGSTEVFSSGQDLLAAAYGDFATSPRRGGFGTMALPPAKPVIAAVGGHAHAGGLEPCLACDLIVSSRTATMGLPGATRSRVAVGGAPFRLPKRIRNTSPWSSPSRGGRGRRSHGRAGLVNRLTEPGEALARAVELAGEVAAAGPLAERASKQTVQRAYDWSDAEGWERQTELTRPVIESEDHEEGMRAFAEKRRPVWKGR